MPFRKGLFSLVKTCSLIAFLKKQVWMDFSRLCSYLLNLWEIKLQYKFCVFPTFFLQLFLVH